VPKPKKSFSGTKKVSFHQHRKKHFWGQKMSAFVTKNRGAPPRPDREPPAQRGAPAWPTAPRAPRAPRPRALRAPQSPLSFQFWQSPTVAHSTSTVTPSQPDTLRRVASHRHRGFRVRHTCTLRHVEECVTPVVSEVT